MRTHLLAVALALGVPACGSSAEPAAQEQAAAIPEVSVDELDRLLAAHACQPVDANGEGTRRKLGVIPGAVLLSDSELYSTSELPADKARPLVFYCANNSCGASHEAAKRARVAGYTVKVLPDGIAGWVKAGKPTAKI